MRNIFTIFQREFATYFNSPVGYIYMIVFLIINAMLVMPTFFSDLQADMRQMFSMLPWLLCVLVPLISMRLWAEDRKENTIEMLLTFPMNPFELVLGKYLASLAFFILTLACTFTIPLMIGYLGSPDWGVIFSSYIGAILLGGFFLAIGIFCSGLVRDQIISAVLSLTYCFLLILLGTDFFVEILDDWLIGFGSLMKYSFGITPHYDSFVRGIMSTLDVLYFFIWIGIFLFLNAFYLEGRNRKNFSFSFSIAIVFCYIIASLFNHLMIDLPLGRIDCTQGKIYSISPSSIEIMKKLDAPVTINLYITPKEKMPSRFKNLEQDIKDKLNEIQLFSDRKIRIKTIHLEASNLLQEYLAEKKQKKEEKNEPNQKAENEIEKSLEETLLSKGIRPFRARTFQGDQYSSQSIYSAIGISYKDKPERIISEVHPYALYDLEYQIMSRIYYLCRARKPVIMLIASKEEIDPRMMQFYMQFQQSVPPPHDPYRPLEAILNKEDFEAKRINLDKNSPLPDPKEYDAIMLIHPKQLNERQKWELAQALRAGKTVLIANQNYTFDYQVDFRTGGASVQKINENPQINDWLQQYGIEFQEDILMDNLNAATASRSQIPLPMHIVISGTNMNHDVSLTSGLNEIVYTWGGALKFDNEKLEKLNLKNTILMKSSPQAWLVSKANDSNKENSYLTNTDIDPKNKNFSQYPLMTLIEGQFPDVYVDAKIPRPKWTEVQKPKYPTQKQDEEEAPFQPVEAKPGKLILIGGSQFFQYNIEQRGREQAVIIEYPENHALVMKTVDFLISNDMLLGNILSRVNISRKIDLPENRNFWKILNYLVMPIFIFLIGIIRSFLRKTHREQYTLAMQMQKQ